MPVGSPDTLSFTVSSDNYSDNAARPTRGYVIDPSSFSLVASGVNLAVALNSPTYFVLRNNAPGVDGVFLSGDTNYDSDFTATVPGAAPTFYFNYHEA